VGQAVQGDDGGARGADVGGGVVEGLAPAVDDPARPGRHAGVAVEHDEEQRVVLVAAVLGGHRGGVVAERLIEDLPFEVAGHVGHGRGGADRQGHEAGGRVVGGEGGGGALPNRGRGQLVRHAQNSFATISVVRKYC
jgi:hypothetical protein